MSGGPDRGDGDHGRTARALEPVAAVALEAARRGAVVTGGGAAPALLGTPPPPSGPV